MTLDNLLWKHASICFDIINVLGIVGKQLSLVLEQTDEGMSGGELLLIRKDILRNREEDAGVLAEEMDVKDLLRVTETKMLKPRV